MNKGIRTKWNGGTMEWRWSGVIVLQGHARDEPMLRENVRRRLVRALSNCERFEAAGLPDRVAETVADRSRFRVTQGPSFWQIKRLEVHYRNPPNGWKWWLRIVDGVQDTSIETDPRPYV